MNTDALLLDTNLLVLYVVGTASRDYIVRHKKLSAYTVEDYDALLALVSIATSVLVTPNTLTETSNLARMIADPARSEVMDVLRRVIESATEVYIPSKEAANSDYFVRLGLTDSAALIGLTQRITLLTADLDLHVAALALGRSTINFNEIRDQYL